MLLNLREIIGHEPFPYSVVHQPTQAEPWTIRVAPALREYRAAATTDAYIDRLADLVAPSVRRSVPLSIGALDVPYAIGYLDAVWKSRTGSHLFVNLDPASVARLTEGIRAVRRRSPLS